MEFLYLQATIIPFEISALNLVLSFWSDNIPAVAICLGCIFLYGYACYQIRGIVCLN